MKVADIYGEITLKGLDKVNNELDTLLKKIETFASKFEAAFGKVKVDKILNSPVSNTLEKELKKVETVLDNISKKAQDAFGMANDDKDWAKDKSDRLRELEKLRASTGNSESNQQNYAEIAKNLSAEQKLVELKDRVNSESNQQNYAEIAKQVFGDEKESKKLNELRDKINEESLNQHYTDMARDIASEEAKRQRQEKAEAKSLEKKAKAEEKANDKVLAKETAEKEKAGNSWKKLILGAVALKTIKKVGDAGMNMLRGSGSEGQDLWALTKSTGEDPREIQDLQTRFAKQGIDAQTYRNLFQTISLVKQGILQGEPSDALSKLNVDPYSSSVPTTIRAIIQKAKNTNDPARFSKVVQGLMDPATAGTLSSINMKEKVSKGESWATIEANHKMQGQFTLFDQRVQRIKDSLSATIGPNVLRAMNDFANIFTPAVVTRIGDAINAITKLAIANLDALTTSLSSIIVSLPTFAKILETITSPFIKLLETADSAGSWLGNQGAISKGVSTLFHDLVTPEEDKRSLMMTPPFRKSDFSNFGKDEPKVVSNKTEVNTRIDNIRVEKEVDSSANKLYGKASSKYGNFTSPSNTRIAR